MFPTRSPNSPPAARRAAAAEPASAARPAPGNAASSSGRVDPPRPGWPWQAPAWARAAAGAGWPIRLLGLFLAIAGARLCIVHTYGVGVPYWDQWDSEAAGLIKPWLEGHWGLSDLFAAHLEHRIVFSRLLALLLFSWNHQWDPLLEMTANLALAALLAVVMASIVWRHFLPAHRDVLLLALVPIFALPYCWENILSGFQSCFYFLLLFSVAAIWGLVTARDRSWGWWTGAVFALAACFTLGSGFFAALAVLGLLALRCAAGRRFPREAELGTGAVCLAVVLVGASISSSVPGHAVLHAESLLSFLEALGACLAWPFVLQPLLALVFYLPIALLAWSYWRHAGNLSERARQRWEVVLALGGWVLLQAAATAYARGTHGQPPSSRYEEMFAFGLWVNLAAAVLLVELFHRQAPARLLPSALTIAWMAAAAAGLGALTIENFAVELPQKRALTLEEEKNTCAYVATGDKKYLADHPLLTIPYPEADRLIALLDDPTLRPILPADIRARLPIRKAGGEPDVFVPNGSYFTVDNPPWLRSWGSFSSLGNPAMGSMASAPLQGGLPYLQIQYCGYLGERKDLAMGLRDLRTRRFTPFQVNVSARESWQAEFIAAPAGPFRLEAADANPDFWFAFREPAEVGRLSFDAGWLLEHGQAILLAGLAILLLALWLCPAAAPAAAAGAAKAAALPAFPGLAAAWRRHAALLQTLLLATLVLFFRKPDALMAAQFFAEDGTVFFRGAQVEGLAAWFHPNGGYLNLVSQMAAYMLGHLFPIIALPTAYNCFALAMVWLVIIKIFSPRLHLPHKPLLALALVLVPHSGEVFLSFTNVQWLLPFLLVALILQDPPTTATQAAGDFALLILCGLTGPFLLLLLPFFLCRLVFGTKSSYNISLIGAACVVCAVQGLFVLGAPPRVEAGEFGTGSVWSVLALRMGGYTLFGPHLLALLWPGFFPIALVVLGALPIVLAGRNGTLRQPALWVFLGLAAAIVLATLQFFKDNVGFLADVHGGDRYFFVPRVMLAWSLILALRPNRNGWIAAGALACMVLAGISDFEYVFPPSLPDWPAQAQALQRGEALTFPINPPGWTVSVPARTAPAP